MRPLSVITPPRVWPCVLIGFVVALYATQSYRPLHPYPFTIWIAIALGLYWLRWRRMARHATQLGLALPVTPIPVAIVDALIALPGRLVRRRVRRRADAAPAAADPAPPPAPDPLLAAPGRPLELAAVATTPAAGLDDDPIFATTAPEAPPPQDDRRHAARRHLARLVDHGWRLHEPDGDLRGRVDVIAEAPDGWRAVIAMCDDLPTSAQIAALRHDARALAQRSGRAVIAAIAATAAGPLYRASDTRDGQLVVIAAVDSIAAELLACGQQPPPR